MLRDDESGYASGESNHESLPEIFFSKPHLKFLNSQLQKLDPQGPHYFHILVITTGINRLQRSSDGASLLSQVSTSLPPLA